MTKLLAILSPIIALPLISGCGSSSASSGQKNLNIVYWYQKGSSVNAMGMWLRHVRQQFEKTHPGVHVSLQKIVSGESAYYTKLDLMQSSASTAPDVVMEDTFLISSDASAGYLKNLTPLVKKWNGWKQYFPALKSITTYGGKTWAYRILPTHGIYGITRTSSKRLVFRFPGILTRGPKFSVPRNRSSASCLVLFP